MKISILMLVFIFPILLLAQKAPIKWKEIPIEDLQMKSYELSPSAPAVVLCDYGQIYFDTNPNGLNLFVFYERHVRIKIINEQGLKYSKISIPFHDMLCEKLESENSKIIKAMVYSLSESGKLIAKKLKNKDIQYRDSTGCIRIAEINLSDVKPGSIIEYIYQTPTFDFIQPKTWYFQREIPVRHSELRMKVPRAFQYMFSSPNITNFDVSEETYYNSISMYYPRGYIPAKLDISGIQMRFVRNNIEAFQCKNFITRPEDYLEKLNIHLVSAIQENMSRAWKEAARSLMITTIEDYDDYEPIQRNSLNYPAGYKIYTLPDWEKFNTNLLNSKQFGLPLITVWDFKAHLDQMLQNKTSSLDQMIAIYDYLRKNMKLTDKSNIKVNAVHSSFVSKVYTKITKKLIKEKSLAEPFQKKEGSNSEINFLLIYFLNKAGIEAHPVIISTRDNGKIDEKIPEIKQFNHVLAYAKIENKEYLLDATDSLRPYDLLDINDLNSKGFLVKGKDFGWIPIVNNNITVSEINEKITLDTNMNFSGQTTIIENGYDAFKHRKELHEKGKEKFISDYKTRFSNSEFDNQLEIDNVENDSLPLIFNIKRTNSFKNENQIECKVNFNPVFGQEDFMEIYRKYPIDFIFPFQKTYVLKISVSDDFIVELPANESYSAFGNKASFDYTVSLNKNKIELKINLQILTSEFSETEYSNLGELFSKLNDKVNDSIVIKKAFNKNIGFNN